MYKSGNEFRVLFGKLYIWHESEDGTLSLVSVEKLERLMAEVSERVAEVTTDV